MSFFDGTNLSQVEETGDYTPIPEGEYTLEATSYEEKVSAAGNQMLKVEYTVAGPQFAGRKIFENFVKGQPVAYGRLKSWIIASGLSGDQEVSQPLINSAMNRRFQANISIEPGSNGFGPQNKVRSFLKPQQQPAPQMQQQPVQPMVDAQAAQPMANAQVAPQDQTMGGNAQFNAQWSK